MSEPPRLSAAPTLETERLTLRGHRRDDFDDCIALWSDPIVTRHIGGRPFTSEEIWARLLRYVGHWTVMGYGYWALHERATGRYLGDVGLGDLQRIIEPRLDAPEMGWVLQPWAHGRGFATEAVRAVLAWNAQHLGAPRTVCIIDPDNAASIRVAEKCGYRPEPPARYHDELVLVFSRPT